MADDTEDYGDLDTMDDAADMPETVETPEAKSGGVPVGTLATTGQSGSNVPAVIGDYAIMQAGIEQVAEMVKENVGDGDFDEFDLTRLKVPSGGGTQWEVPGLDGVEHMATLEGVIIAWKDARGYWKVDFDESGGGSPPDCSSPDGRHGFGDPGGDCKSCPLAQFGSADKGEGQACKATRIMFFMRPDSLLPLVVVAPPTSLKGIRQYMMRLASNGAPFYGIKTKLTLERDRNKNGITYSKIIPAAGEKLSPEEAARMKEFGMLFKPALEAEGVQQSDVAGE